MPNCRLLQGLGRGELPLPLFVIILDHLGHGQLVKHFDLAVTFDRESFLVEGASPADFRGLLLLAHDLLFAHGEVVRRELRLHRLRFFLAGRLRADSGLRAFFPS